MKPKNDNSAVLTNRKARRDYFILEVFEAGLELKGNEVKSLRAGRASINEGFARPEGQEIFLYNMHISPYEYSDNREYDPLRPKKLLLHKREIVYLISKVSQRGLSLVPLEVYFKKGYAKVRIALVKGKRAYDKRQALRRKEAEREIERAKRYRR